MRRKRLSSLTHDYSLKEILVKREQAWREWVRAFSDSSTSSVRFVEIMRRLNSLDREILKQTYILWDLENNRLERKV